MPTSRPGSGFASLTPTRRREISAQGGKAAHQQGAAHEWTVDEARAAGKKGGMARRTRAVDVRRLSEKRVG
jgi:general stress protein YciG